LMKTKNNEPSEQEMRLREDETLPDI